MVNIDADETDADWTKRTPDTNEDIARGAMVERENRRMAASVQSLAPPSVRRPKE